MKQLVYIFCFLFVINCVHAQDSLAVKTDSIKTTIAKNTVFVELLGNGFFYSVNYDRILLHKKKNNIAARIGASFFPNENPNNHNEKNNQWSIPFELNYFYGNKSRKRAN